MRTLMPASSIHERTRAWTSCIGAERKRRVVKPGSSVYAARVRQRAMTSRARESGGAIRVSWGCFVERILRVRGGQGGEAPAGRPRAGAASPAFLDPLSDGADQHHLPHF